MGLLAPIFGILAMLSAAMAPVAAHSDTATEMPKMQIPRIIDKPDTATDQTFTADMLKAHGPVPVESWVEWARPTKTIGPALEEIARQFADKLIVAKVDIVSNPNTPKAYAVRGTPTQIPLRNGKPVATQVGALPKVRLRDRTAGNLFRA
jgi:thioredoxin 1